MVLTDPGMGKSTLLQMEALATAIEEGEKLSKDEKGIDQVLFPLLFRLSGLDAQDTFIAPAETTKSGQPCLEPLF